MKYEMSDNCADSVIYDLLCFLEKERYSTASSYFTSTLNRQNTTKLGTLFDENQVLGWGRLNIVILSNAKLLVMGSTYDAKNFYYEFALYPNVGRFYLSKKNNVIKLMYGKSETFLETNFPDKVRVQRLLYLNTIEKLTIPVDCLLDVVSYYQLFERAKNIKDTGKGQK